MKFRPLHDRVVVKRVAEEEKTKGGIIIPDTAKEKPMEGEIVSVGPGARDESGKLVPLDVKAGDRMPYFLVDDQNIFDKLNEPKFHLLVFSTELNDLQALKGQLEARHVELVDFHAISHSREVGEVFGTSKNFMVLLRPDNHFAFLSSDISSSAVREYFDEFIGTL